MYNKAIFNLKKHLFKRALLQSQKACINYQKMPSSKRETLSLQQRIDLIKYAYHYCPFYKKIYDKYGFHPSQIKSEKDWRNVPIIEKNMIKRHTPEFFSVLANQNKLCPSSTGGSTGMPLVVYKSKNVHYEVLAWRALSWYGIGPWDNEAIVHRRVPTTVFKLWLNRGLWWPTKRSYLNATNISDAKIRIFIDEIKKFRIKWVVGYCGSLEYVADYIINNTIVIDSVKLVWSTSSPLTQIVREKLEKAFRCPVMDQYGCCEMGNIALQKPTENCLTVNSDYVHIDIVNGNTHVPEGVVGDICITDLHCKEFPLIKYRLGDRASIISSMNKSHDGFPKLSFVKGRTTDMLPLPNGDVLDGSYLTTICDKYIEYISCYQIYQESNFNIIFYVVPKEDNPFTDNIISRIKNHLFKISNNQIDIKIKKVSSIPDFAGKRKFIISELTTTNSSKLI